MYSISNLQPNRLIDKINWRVSQVNIIYIPFTDANFVLFFKSIPNMRLIYKEILIPDNITIAGLPVRSAKYISDVKQEIKTAKIIKSVSKLTQRGPVIVDTTPVFNTLQQRIKGSGGTLRYFNEFFKFVNSIYESLDHKYSTIVLYDNSQGSVLDTKRLLTWFRYNQFKMPVQITDSYGIMYLGSNLGYYVLHTQDAVLRPNSVKIEKFVENLAKSISKEEAERLLDTTIEESQLPITVDKKIVAEALKKEYAKEVDPKLVETITSLVNTFLKDKKDIAVKLTDIPSVIKVIKLALEYSNHSIGNKSNTLKELIDTTVKTHLFKKDIAPNLMQNKIKPSGLDNYKLTNIKYVLDPGRLATEFNENLDQNIAKMISALNDPKFKIKIINIDKEVVDDNANRYINYKIKIKPDKGRVYEVKLRVPTLINDNYLKIGGQTFVLNNQLMQKPILKKSENEVLFKTNYSVTTYSLKRSKLAMQSYTSIVDNFLNEMKNLKKLKEAKSMSAEAEKELIDYGIPTQIVKDLMYEKIELTFKKGAQ